MPCVHSGRQRGLYCYHGGDYTGQNETANESRSEESDELAIGVMASYMSHVFTPHNSNPCWARNAQQTPHCKSQVQISATLTLCPVTAVSCTTAQMRDNKTATTTTNSSSSRKSPYQGAFPAVFVTSTVTQLVTQHRLGIAPNPESCVYWLLRTHRCSIYL